MAEPYIGEVRIVGFNFAPRDWAECNGQELPISQNQTLYALLGTTFGGNGVTTFKLPDLRGRTPIHPYPEYGILQGSSGGQEAVALSLNKIPAHTHAVMASSQDADDKAANQGTEMFAVPAVNNIYRDPGNLVSFHDKAVSKTGVNNPQHNNLQPSSVIKYVISLKGYFPPRT